MPGRLLSTIQQRRGLRLLRPLIGYAAQGSKKKKGPSPPAMF